MDAREGRGRKSLSQFGDGPGKIVTVHIRTVEFEKLHLSQIGCAVVGSDQAFFRAIKTAGLEASFLRVFFVVTAAAVRGSRQLP